jgi:hypothetical protein
MEASMKRAHSLAGVLLWLIAPTLLTINGVFFHASIAAAGDAKTALQKYQAVKFGMSLKQVEAILGDKYIGVYSLNCLSAFWEFNEGEKTLQTVVVRFDFQEKVAVKELQERPIDKQKGK